MTENKDLESLKNKSTKKIDKALKESDFEKSGEVKRNSLTEAKMFGGPRPDKDEEKKK